MRRGRRGRGSAVRAKQGSARAEHRGWGVGGAGVMRVGAGAVLAGPAG